MKGKAAGLFGNTVCRKMFMNNKYLYINQNIELEYQPDSNILLKVKGINSGFGSGKYSINQIGAEILCLIDGSRTYRELVDYLATKYQEDGASIEKKLLPFLNKLQEVHKIEILEGEKDNRPVIISYNDNNYPRVATIELTNACNLKCIHCYGGFGDKSEFMSIDDVYKVLDELNDMGVMVIELTGGEISMHPNFNEIITYALSLDFNRISLLTNGVKLEQSTLELIIENKDRIFIQIDFQSFDDKYLEWFTKRKNTLNSITHNIKVLANHQVPMRIATMVTNRNMMELEKIADWVHGLGIKLWGLGLVIPLGRAGEHNPDLVYANEDNPELAKFINTIDKKYPGFISVIDDPRIDKANCGAISSHIVIGCDGRTKICAMDTGDYFDSGIGNAIEVSMKTLYKVQKEFIHSFSLMKAPNYSSVYCKECENKYLCHGCVLRGILSAKKKGDQCRWYLESVDENIRQRFDK